MSSSDGDRSPKRQRRSYSPASPAPATYDSKPFVQTPPPSVHMSPTYQAASISTTGSTTFPTPPSTAGFQSQPQALGSELGAESGEATPAPETEHRKDETGEDVEMQNTGTEATHGNGPMTGKVEAGRDGGEHRRTDHERSAGDIGDNGGAMEGDESPLPPPPPPPRLFKLSAQPAAPARPNPSENIITLYSLNAIQLSVARKDAAGNKINKLRKSYEGKVKALGLLGRSKAQVGNNALMGLVDPGWDMEMGDGQIQWAMKASEFPLGAPETKEELLGKLGTALKLAPGTLPKQEHEHWRSLLALDEAVPKPGATPPVTATKGVISNPALAKTAPAQTMRSSTPSSPAYGLGGGGALRPDRAGKKRRYDESSYAGYQEGYDDDGYSTGGGDDSGSRRGSTSKRRKMVGVA